MRGHVVPGYLEERNASASAGAITLNCNVKQLSRKGATLHSAETRLS